MALRLPVNVDKSFASPKLHNRLNQCRAPVDSLKSQGLLLLHWLRSKMNKCSSLQMLQMISKLRQELETALPRSECCTSRPQTVKNLLECCCCEGFMSHPVCIPCGHTVCRSCLNRAGSVVTCPKCNEKHSKLPFGGESPRKTTLILTNLQQKLNPAALSCCRHREEGNKFAQEGDFPLAVEAYDKAADSGNLYLWEVLSLSVSSCWLPGIRDHRVYSNRSRAQFAIGSMHKALQDAEICCSLKPFWPKVCVPIALRFNMALCSLHQSIVCTHLVTGRKSTHDCVFVHVCVSVCMYIHVYQSVNVHKQCFQWHALESLSKSCCFGEDWPKEISCSCLSPVPSSRRNGAIYS